MVMRIALTTFRNSYIGAVLIYAIFSAWAVMTLSILGVPPCETSL